MAFHADNKLYRRQTKISFHSNETKFAHGSAVLTFAILSTFTRCQYSVLIRHICELSDVYFVSI